MKITNNIEKNYYLNIFFMKLIKKLKYFDKESLMKNKENKIEIIKENVMLNLN